MPRRTLSDTELLGSAPKLVAQLPPTAPIGATDFVSDANAATFNTTAAGGGANLVPVFWNGSVWKIG